MSTKNALGYMLATLQTGFYKTSRRLNIFVVNLNLIMINVLTDDIGINCLKMFKLL